MTPFEVDHTCDHSTIVLPHVSDWAMVAVVSRMAYCKKLVLPNIVDPWPAQPLQEVPKMEMLGSNSCGFCCDLWNSYIYTRTWNLSLTPTPAWINAVSWPWYRKGGIRFYVHPLSLGRSEIMATGDARNTGLSMYLEYIRLDKCKIIQCCDMGHSDVHCIARTKNTSGKFNP